MAGHRRAQRLLPWPVAFNDGLEGVGTFTTSTTLDALQLWDITRWPIQVFYLEALSSAGESAM